ncbi:NACHT and WD domain protein [Hypomontagnella monticulosa]|nr:NACHT and WD domain protein [Hypomontagnella monticulosa]
MSDTPPSSHGPTGDVPIHTRNSSAAYRLNNDARSSKDTAADPIDPIDPPRPSIKERFTSAWVNRRPDKDADEGIRGPMGLRVLHSSPEPLVDLIFVHGLRGGSIKTWRKGDDPRMFWPRLWLPTEPGLQHVNIHSFGYDSDWASTKPSILNVHDFGQSLLEEMRNSPHLREHPSRPIVLLGHSMGGLVVKKAFILAKDIPDFQDRIRCLFFLATPHRGSDYAKILNNILTASGIMSSRQYIADLTTGSTSTEQINVAFGKYANDLPIFSFYETLRMNLGLSSGLIVEKSSAILGPDFTNERVQYINANHRDICKFDSKDNPNYLTLRNALSSAINDLIKDASKSALPKFKGQLRILKSYFGISDRPDEHFPTVDGSCQWIDSREDFQDWRDSPDDFVPEKNDGVHDRPSIFWVHANPGTGKTHLASHVVSELRSFQLECACYYFHVGSKSSRSLGDFLRSIAYQMATVNASIRQTLTSLLSEESSFDLDDTRAIWAKFFKQGIFQSRVRTPQYWVIDAIDECNKYQEFFAMVKGEKPGFPLRIFLTSRKLPDMPKLCHSLTSSTTLTCIDIPVNDSVHDIERYLYSRIEDLPIDTITDKQNFAERILHKSNASFLWVRLVLDELEHVYSNESILQVLNSVPQGMVPYYERTTRAMAENRLEKHISQAILLWTVASVRNLTVSELSQALNLDIKTVLPSAKNAVEGLCGQLVSVNPSSSLVSLVHPTAREFLLSEAAGEFYISRSLAHERIAVTCLQLLCGAGMKPPRNRRLAGAESRQQEKSPLLDYAMTQFSEHIYSASAVTDKLLSAIDRFFKTNVLSWIEKIARKRDLHCLIRASKNLKAYLDRRDKSEYLLNNQVQNIVDWSVDLSRIVTQFGAVLVQDPSSIYFLIPPLCPSDSAIYRQFGIRPDGLSIIGFKDTAWNDCISVVSFDEDSIPAAVSCGDNLIAVGMESGDINLYNHRTCQRVGMISQKNPIDLVHLTNRHVAACTIRSITVRDLEGNTIWENRIRFRCILLRSSSDSLLAMSEHGHFLKWDLSSGVLLEDYEFAYRSYDEDSDPGGLSIKAPSLASISPDMEMLALGYRGGAVCLWDLQTRELVGWALDEENKLASILLFNPNPDTNLLLVIYSNHDLSLYDSWSGNLVQCYKTSTDMGILSAACSPDGRTLATIDTRGRLQIWDFESLTLLYHVLCPATSFRILEFTSDGSSIVDATDSSMRVWSPSSLVRKNIEEDQSVSDSAVHLAAIEGQYELLRTSRITSLCAHPSLSIAFLGKYTGQVVAVNTQTGQQVSVLYCHSPPAFITRLTVGRDIIASSDANSVLQVWKLAITRTLTPTCESLLLHTSVPGPVAQLCLSADGDFLLVSTAQLDLVYSMKDGSCVGSLPFEPHERHAWRWMQGFGQDFEEHFILLNNHRLQRYSACAFPSALNRVDIYLNYELAAGDIETGARSAFIHAETHILVLEISYNSGYVSSSAMFLFNLKAMSDQLHTTPWPLSNSLPRYSKHFVGISRRMKSLLFLHRDSWLCSIDLNSTSTTIRQFTRHFFVPKELIPSNHRVLPIKSADDNIVFCLHDELSIVKNGLKFREVRSLE